MKKAILFIIIGIVGGLLIANVTTYAMTGQDLLSLLTGKVNSMVDTIKGENDRSTMIADEQNKAKQEMSQFMDTYLADVDSQLRAYNQTKRDGIKKSIQDKVQAQKDELNADKQQIIDAGKAELDKDNNKDLDEALKDTQKEIDDIIKDKLK